jgi:hypothetical protein
LRPFLSNLKQNADDFRERIRRCEPVLLNVINKLKRRPICRARPPDYLDVRR